METESLVRLGAFIGILLAMAAWETASPKRKPRVSRLQRWSSNLSLVALNTILVRLLMPAGAVGAAIFAETRGWGLLNILALPEWTAVIPAVVLLDLAIYAQHVIFHAIPMLWRLHMVHHADPDIDVTTGLRFHPVEIMLSMLIKMAVIILLGAPILAVIIFEVLLNATAMFNHGYVLGTVLEGQQQGQATGAASTPVSQTTSRAASTTTATAFRQDCSLAGDYFQRGYNATNNDDKIYYLQKGLQYCATDVRAQNDLGVAYYQRGDRHDTDRARDHFQAALRLDPNYSPARQNLNNL